MWSLNSDLVAKSEVKDIDDWMQFSENEHDHDFSEMFLWNFPYFPVA